MVALSEIRSSNTSLPSTHPTYTAVFIGATSGIGLATLTSLATHIPSPHAIIIGRSATAFAPHLQALKEVNPKGTFTFLEADVNLLSSIDALTPRITAELEKGEIIDLLFTSQGYISFAGRESNADGLDTSISLRYYGRLRFATQLQSLLSSHARVFSVLAGGKEGKIIEDDLDLERNYGVISSMDQFATMTTLSFDHLAAQSENKNRTYIHVFPGNVSTGLLGRSAKGWFGVLMRWVIEPVIDRFVALKPEEVGERMLFYATSGRYEGGSLSLDWDGEGKETGILRGYRERGMAERVWEHNEKMFGRAVGV